MAFNHGMARWGKFRWNFGLTWILENPFCSHVARKRHCEDHAGSDVSRLSLRFRAARKPSRTLCAGQAFTFIEELGSPSDLAGQKNKRFVCTRHP